MIQEPISQRKRLVLGVLSIVVLLGLYTWLSARQHARNPLDSTIPTWSQLKTGVSQAFTPDMRGQRWIVEDVKATGGRLLLGLSIGVSLGMLAGLMMGCFPVVDALLAPPLLFLSRIVPTAALAVFFALVGTGLSMYATMIAFGTLPSLALAFSMEVKGFPEELRNKVYTLGASECQVIWNAVFKSTLPKLIDLIMLSIGPAMVYLIGAELLVGDVGLGYRIRILSRRLEMQVVYPYLVFLAAFGFLITYGLGCIRSRLSPWTKHGRR